MFDCIFWKWSSPVFQPTLSLAENRSYTQENKSFKTTWAVIEKKNLSSGCQHFPLSLRLCPVPLFKQRTSNTEMKIPSLCNVYSAFSHIPRRSVHNLPPLFTIFPDASSLEPAIDCRWKGRRNREDGNEGGGRTRGPRGDPRSPLRTCFAVRPRRPPRPQLPVEKTCPRMFWVSHGKRPCLGR